MVTAKHIFLTWPFGFSYVNEVIFAWQFSLDFFLRKKELFFLFQWREFFSSIIVLVSIHIEKESWNTVECNKETNIYIFYISKSESLDKYPCEMRCNTMYVDMLQIVFFHPITFFKLGYSFRQNIFFCK